MLKSNFKTYFKIILYSTVEDVRKSTKETYFYDTKTKEMMVFINMKWSGGHQRMISYRLVHDIFNDRVTRTKSLQH